MYRGWSSTLYITLERRLSMANRVCVLCGAKYDYCPNCDADKGKPIWMTCWDKAECHDIWVTKLLQ